MAPAICEERKRLLDALLETIREVMKLQDQEFVSITASGEALARFELALTAARLKRDRIREEIKLHMLSHGCA